MTNAELSIAASTVWVVVAAVLVMFMQAGFAFLEAGLTRMKNVGHIAAKNALVLGIASIVYYVVGYGIAFGDGGGGLFGSSGFFPSADTLLAIGSAPFSWFQTIPAGAGYLFQEESRIKRHPPSLSVNPYPREVLRSLDIHVLVEAEVGQLGPKGDIKAEGQVQSPIHIGVGHDAHRRGAAVGWETEAVI